MPYLGEISALITALLWSGTAIVFTEATNKVGSYIVNITRLILATIFLVITILTFQLNYQIEWQQIYLLGLSGIIGLVFGDGFLFKSFQYIGARLSMLVMTLAPPISAILAYFYLGEQLSNWAIIGLVLTITGVSVVIFKRSEQPSSNYKTNNLGYLFAFLGAVGQAVNLIYAKEAFQIGEINGFVATFYRMVPSIPLMYLLGYLTRKKRTGIKVLLQKKDALVLILIGSIIGPFLGITFSLIAVAHTYVGIASTLMATVPIIMLPIVIFYYKEKLSLFSIIGAFLAVVGIAVLFLK